MKNLHAIGAGSAPLWVSVTASAQSGHMTNNGMWGGGWMGGYGGYWVPVLVLVIIGLVAWIAMQKRK